MTNIVHAVAVDKVRRPLAEAVMVDGVERLTPALLSLWRPLQMSYLHHDNGALPIQLPLRQGPLLLPPCSLQGLLLVVTSSQLLYRSWRLSPSRVVTSRLLVMYSIVALIISLLLLIVWFVRYRISLDPESDCDTTVIAPYSHVLCLLLQVTASSSFTLFIFFLS